MYKNRDNGLAGNEKDDVVVWFEMYRAGLWKLDELVGCVCLLS